ncbi:MAG: hypothetical protein AAGF25_08895, partial [Pseudomonadota bacterium]
TGMTEIMEIYPTRSHLIHQPLPSIPPLVKWEGGHRTYLSRTTRRLLCNAPAGQWGRDKALIFYHSNRRGVGCGMRTFITNRSFYPGANETPTKFGVE